MIRIEHFGKTIISNPYLHLFLYRHFLVGHNNTPVDGGGGNQREVPGSGSECSDALILPQLASFRPFPNVVPTKDSNESANLRGITDQDIG